GPKGAGSGAGQQGLKAPFAGPQLRPRDDHLPGGRRGPGQTGKPPAVLAVEAAAAIVRKNPHDPSAATVEVQGRGERVEDRGVRFGLRRRPRVACAEPNDVRGAGGLAERNRPALLDLADASREPPRRGAP